MHEAKRKEIIKLHIVVDHLTAVQELGMEKEYISLVRRACRRQGPVAVEGMEILEDEGVVIIDEGGLTLPVCVAETMEFLGLQAKKGKRGGDKRIENLHKSLKIVAQLKPDLSTAQTGLKPESSHEYVAHIAHIVQEQVSPPPPAPAKKVVMEGFDQFWQAYPRRDSRGDAEKAWLKAIKLASPEVIIAGAKRYAASRVGQDPTYTKTPGPWLNAKKWLDTPPPQRQYDDGLKDSDYGNSTIGGMKS